jgi:hypothetical protein
VTIGSGLDPGEGNLLDLKQNDNLEENAKSGLLLPRVNLVVKDELHPMFSSGDPLYTEGEKIMHTGLLIYNLTSDATEDLCPGPYVWSGSTWIRLWESCSFFDFLCETISNNKYSKPEGEVFSSANSINYNSNIEVEITANKIYSYGNGLSILVTPQKIQKAASESFYFYVQSDGTTPSGTYELSLSDLNEILGTSIPSSCTITVEILTTTFSIDCANVFTTATVNSEMNKTVQIPYTVSNVPYTIPAGNIGSAVNNIVPSIASEQILTTKTGYITVTLQGSPTSPGSTLVPIAIGNTSCSVTVNVSSPMSIICGNVYTTGYFGIDMSATSATSIARIPYTLSSSSYSLPAGEIGTYGSITAYVEAQTLSAPSGYITVKFSGTPTSTLDKVPFSINVAGNTCSIYLSVIKPPADCTDGTSARAFVFQQGAKWYVVTTKGVYNSVSVAQTVECDSEEEALGHKDALQYCGTLNTNRCIRLFYRDGTFAGNVFMSSRSAGWLGGIAEGNTGCWASIIAYSGSRIQSTTYGIGYLGAINLSGGVGYLGVTTATATLTTNALR